MQNCAIEVNEKSHFIEEQDNLIFNMKTSDFLKVEQFSRTTDFSNIYLETIDDFFHRAFY